ncbi:MAG: NUDIX domain-containing protein [Bacteroidota bacterium]
MTQIYKVYLKNKEVIFKNHATEHSNNNCVIFSKLPEGADLTAIIRNFESDSEFQKIELLYHNPKELFSAFSAPYKQVGAAGGLVRNSAAEMLFIFRNGVWDLPKGKAETGETPEQCAVREVEEETGLSQLKITNDLPSTFHTYSEHGVSILKKTYWFEMLCKNSLGLKPQMEEGIAEVRWFISSEIDVVLQNTYLSIRNLIEDYLNSNSF